MDLIEATGRHPRRHPWETARLRIIRHLIARHGPPSNGSTIVDVGCGDAFVALNLAAEYRLCNVIGVDSSFRDEVLAELNANQQHDRIKFVRSVADAAQISRAPSRPVSLILLMDVLEHVEDDAAFLGELIASGLVGPETCLIVTVPAYQWLWSAHDVFLRHYRRYTRPELVQCLAHKALHVDRSGYLFASLIPLRMLTVGKRRVFGRHDEARSELTAVPGGSIGAAAVAWLLAADAYVSLALGRIGCVLPGLSAYAICRKSA